jgi:hypothetical protein
VGRHKGRQREGILLGLFLGPIGLLILDHKEPVLESKGPAPKAVSPPLPAPTPDTRVAGPVGAGASSPTSSRPAVWGFACAVVAWLVLGLGLIQVAAAAGSGKPPASVLILVAAIPGLAGLVFSWIGLRETSSRRTRDGAVAKAGRGWAIAGFVLTALPTLFFLVIVDRSL